MITAPAAAATVVRILDVGDLPLDGAFWHLRMRDAELAACAAYDRMRVHLAARLAAKLACLALLNAEESPQTCREIEVRSTPRTPPHLVLHGGMAERAAAGRIDEVALSLSHTATRAAACVAADPAGRRVVGIDLLDVRRWELAVRRSGEPLVARVTSPAERAYDQRHGHDSAGASAARFSVKECVVKALGGFPAGTGFHDIDVMIDERGTVHVNAGGTLAAHMQQAGLVVLGAELQPLSDDHLQSVVVMAKHQGGS